MANDRESYRRIMFSTAVMGGATVAVIIIGIIRTKVFALALGPAGIGILGLLTSIMATAAAVGGMGINFSGVRQIAADVKTRSVARRALWLAVWPLAVVTALIIWFGRIEIAQWVTGSRDQAFAVGLMGAAAALTIVAAAQTTVIQGVGHVGDLAKARIWGALLSLLIGVPAVLYAGALGIALAVIAVPLGNLLSNLPYRPEASLGSTPTRSQLLGQMRQLLTLGATFMIVTAVGSAVLVVIRTLVIRQYGLEAAGLYQAAYSISALNASLVLSAMATDYFPRLSAVQEDRSKTVGMINQQLHSALLLASPILIGMLALAPLLLRILYSGAFTAGAELLRWQLTGELFKLPGWALAFLLLARADKSLYLFVEGTFVVAYGVGTLLLLPVAGIAGAGFAYGAAYLIYSLLLIAVCARRHGAKLTVQNQLHLGLVGAILIALSLLGGFAPRISALAGTVIAAGFGAYTLRHLYEIRKPVS